MAKKMPASITRGKKNPAEAGKGGENGGMKRGLRHIRRVRRQKFQVYIKSKHHQKHQDKPGWIYQLKELSFGEIVGVICFAGIVYKLLADFSFQL